MNNSTVDDTAQKEIYIVQGNNWASEVELNEFNLQFDLETKYDEAATKVIERLKGFDNGLEINLSLLYAATLHQRASGSWPSI